MVEKIEIKNFWHLIGAIIVCHLAGAIGYIYASTAIPSWYAFLNKPFFTPPNWAFSLVWSLLYTLMGISLYLVWQRGMEKGIEKIRVKKAIWVFEAQLALNALWSIVFFGFKSPFYGLVEIIILWAAVLFTIIKFNEVSKRAAWLLIPYFIWVSFALVLNYFILTLNP